MQSNSKLYRLAVSQHTSHCSTWFTFKDKAYLTCKGNPDLWLPKFLCSVFFKILLKPAINNKNTKNYSPKTAHIPLLSKTAHLTEYVSRNIGKKKLRRLFYQSSQLSP